MNSILNGLNLVPSKFLEWDELTEILYSLEDWEIYEQIKQLYLKAICLLDEDDPAYPKTKAAALLSNILIFNFSRISHLKRKELSQIIELDNKLADAYFFRGLLNARCGEYDIAEHDFCQAIEHGEGHILAVFYRGIVRKIKGIFKANADLEMVFKTHESSYDISLIKSISQIQLGLYADAAGTLSEYLSKAERKEIYLYRGIAYYKLQEYENAIKDFEEVSIISDGSRLVRIFLSLSYYNIGDLSSSSYEITKDAKSREDPEAAFLLGCLEYKEGCYSNALKYFQVAFESCYSLSLNLSYKLQPQNILSLGWKSWFKDIYNKIYYFRSLTYLGLQQDIKAQQDINRYLRSNPENTDALFIAAVIKIALDQPADAIRDLDEVLKTKSDLAEVYFYKGIANALLGRKATSHEAFQLAIQLDSNFRRVLEELHRPVVETRLDENSKHMDFNHISILYKIEIPDLVNKEIALKYIKYRTNGCIKTIISPASKNNMSDLKILIKDLDTGDGTVARLPVEVDLSIDINNQIVFCDIDYIYFKLLHNQEKEVQLKFEADHNFFVFNSLISEAVHVSCLDDRHASSLSSQVVRASNLNWGSFENESIDNVFKHIDKYGSITEQELTTMLGSPRQVRLFSSKLEQYLKQLPFTVQIEVTTTGKRYVKMN